MFQIISTTSMTTDTPDMACNYGVNYTVSSDFYGTYILDTCYILNTKTAIPPLDVSVEYECDYITGEIHENVWWNEFCIGNLNHTNPGRSLQTKHCDINKQGKQCNTNYIWLNSFRQHSQTCSPHEHTIIKYGMILDECIFSEIDSAAFKNIYTQTESHRRQIIQFQYLCMEDCLIDNVTADKSVSESIADDIYDFIHEQCTNGLYYTIQPHEIVDHQIDPITTVQTLNTSLQSVSPWPTLSVCNYMMQKETDTGFYSTIIEHKCYSHEIGSKKYEYKNAQFMVSEWINDRFCDGFVNQSKITTKNDTNINYIESNNKECDTVTVLQYYDYSNGNCSQHLLWPDSFRQEYTFIINNCLKYKKNKNGLIYIYNKYNKYDNPNQMVQFYFNSYNECINVLQFDIETIGNVVINHEQCLDGYYYEILVSKNYEIDPFSNIMSKPSNPFSNKLFGTVIIIFGLLQVMCCGIICWCGWLKGLWNILCCGKYNKLSDGHINNNEGDSDDSANIFMNDDTTRHVLMHDDDNVDLAILSISEDISRDDDLQKRNNIYAKFNLISIMKKEQNNPYQIKTASRQS